MLSPILKVGGVGDGTFILLIFFALALLIAIIGYQTTRPVMWAVVGFSIPIILLIIFILVPKGRETSTVTEEYDENWGRRVGITVMLSICAALGLGLMFLEYVLMPVKASRIRPLRLS